MALDKTPEDARPWIEAAAPTHPSLADTRHLIADPYNMVNVAIAVWIDEAGRIGRPGRGSARSWRASSTFVNMPAALVERFQPIT